MSVYCVKTMTEIASPQDIIQDPSSIARTCCLSPAPADRPENPGRSRSRHEKGEIFADSWSPVPSNGSSSLTSCSGRLDQRLRQSATPLHSPPFRKANAVRDFAQSRRRCSSTGVDNGHDEAETFPFGFILLVVVAECTLRYGGRACLPPASSRSIRAWIAMRDLVLEQSAPCL